MTVTEPLTLIVDRSACAGHGICYGEFPDLIDCDEQGDPIVPDRVLLAAEVRAAQEAVAICPERALSLAITTAERQL